MGTVLQLSDDDNVLRRVPTFLPSYVKPDGTISSMAFSPRKGDKGLSVDLERLSSFDKVTLGDPRYRVLRVNIGYVRNEINDGLDVEHDPLEDNEAHSLITGKITRGKRGQLMKGATEIVE